MLSHTSRASLYLALLLTIATFARSASAQVWVDANDPEGRLPDWVDKKYVRPIPPPRYEPLPPPRYEPLPPPHCEPQYRRVWVEPCYRVICKRIWVPPVVRVVYERVWVPARYEIRETVCWENGVKVIRREHVCVEPGHYQSVRREIVEVPGCWRMEETKELVSGGYWKMERV